MSAEPESIVENFFRHEYAALVATLTRTFGFTLIDVIEDMVQEALAEALRSWRISGIPDNPEGWLHRVAKNRVIDWLRRDKRQLAAGDEWFAALEDDRAPALTAEEIQDSMLRMIFACCHPTLDRTSQLALTLKLLCGLGDHEIARGLLSTSEAIKKRITRAKRQLQANGVALELPASALLHERLDAVHDVLYLMFNEGYSATRGDQPLRIDLCEESARLCHLMCQSETSVPTTRALLALMLFHAARFDARVSEDGAAVLLEDQDRSVWDRDMIRVAEHWLTRSANGKEISRFHLEAGIARLHCVAGSVEDTDWEGILRHYDLLSATFPSPLYELNRAIVLGRLDRADEGLEVIMRIRASPAFRDYPLLYCVQADLLTRLRRVEEARQMWDLSLVRVRSEHERVLIRRRLDELA